MFEELTSRKNFNERFWLHNLLRKTIFFYQRLFLKLFLILQIISYHCFKTEATKNNFPMGFNESKVGEEQDFNDQIPDKDTRLSEAERQKTTCSLVTIIL